MTHINRSGWYAQPKESNSVGAYEKRNLSACTDLRRTYSVLHNLHYELIIRWTLQYDTQHASI